MTDVAKLLSMLQSPRASTRYDACEELRVAETIPPEAIAALGVAVADPDPSVAEAAQRALGTHIALGTHMPASDAPAPATTASDPVMLLARSIITRPSILDDYPGDFLVVYDQAVTYPRFDNLNRAICLAGKRGWKALSISNLNMPVLTGTQSMMYVLLERVPASAGNHTDSHPA